MIMKRPILTNEQILVYKKAYEVIDAAVKTCSKVTEMPISKEVLKRWAFLGINPISQ